MILAAIVVLGVAARAAAGPAATRQLQLNDVDVHAAPNATVAATNDCRLGNTTIPCRPACESAAAGCSEFSVISAGTCDSTPGESKGIEPGMIRGAASCVTHNWWMTALMS